MTSRNSRMPPPPPPSGRSWEEVPPRSSSKASREFKTDKDPVYVTIPQAEYDAYKAAAEKYGMYQVLYFLSSLQCFLLFFQGHKNTLRRRHMLTDS